MSKYVADTMALVLRLEHRKMPASAKAVFSKAESGNAVLFIPAMVLSEIGYLVEKRRIETSLEDVRQYLDHYSSVKEHPLTFKTVEVAFKISDIPELHDRLIAGSAQEIEAIIITNDPDMEASQYVQTLWK